MSRGYRPCHALDVEVSERDVDALVVAAVKQIMTLGVSRVEAGVVRRRERAVGTLPTAVDKSALWTHTHSDHAARQRICGTWAVRHATITR